VEGAAVRTSDSSNHSIRLPLAGVTGAAIAVVPAVTWLGFAAAGAPWLGIAPSLIGFATLWLLHHYIGHLHARLQEAHLALAEHAALAAQQRLNSAALERRLADGARGVATAHEATAFALAKLIEMRDPSAC
jgi:hypothetical protein